MEREKKKERGEGEREKEDSGRATEKIKEKIEEFQKIKKYPQLH